jgi:hypothetical protein
MEMPPAIIEKTKKMQKIIPIINEKMLISIHPNSINDKRKTSIGKKISEG